MNYYANMQVFRSVCIIQVRIQAKKLFIVLVADNSLRRREGGEGISRGAFIVGCRMVRNSLNEFTPCFFSVVLLREGEGLRTLSSCFSPSSTRYIRNPALFLECLLIRHTLTSRRAISVKRQFIFPALYARCIGQKCAWPAKGNVWGVA